MPATAIAGRLVAGTVTLGAGLVAVDKMRGLLEWREQRLVAGPADVGLQAEDIALVSTAGTRLHAWWVSTDMKAPAVVVVHGFASHAGDLLPVAPLLRAAGFHVLMLDLRGHGRSERPVDRPRPPHLVDDVVAAMDWLGGRDEVGGIGLLGHSMGGSTIIQAAARDQRVRAVVSVAGVADPTLSRIGWWPAWISRGMLASIAIREDVDPSQTFAVNRIRDVTAPTLLVHGEMDGVVPVAHAHALHRSRPDAELILVPGAGHASFDAFAPALERSMTFLRDALGVSQA